MFAELRALGDDGERRAPPAHMSESFDRSVSVSRLREWTAADISEKADPRVCDLCGEAQILGCTVALHLGIEYREACAGCAEKLRTGLKAVLGEAG